MRTVTARRHLAQEARAWHPHGQAVAHHRRSNPVGRAAKSPVPQRPSTPLGRSHIQLRLLSNIAGRFWRGIVPFICPMPNHDVPNLQDQNKANQTRQDPIPTDQHLGPDGPLHHLVSALFGLRLRFVPHDSVPDLRRSASPLVELAEKILRRRDVVVAGAPITPIRHQDFPSTLLAYKPSRTWTMPVPSFADPITSANFAPAPIALCSNLDRRSSKRRLTSSWTSRVLASLSRSDLLTNTQTYFRLPEVRRPNTASKAVSFH